MARKILIIDDNPDDREIMRFVLNDLGRKEELEFAQSGNLVLERLRGGDDQPSIIFLDLKLPNMSGIEILRQIRAVERLDDIPVIIVTGSSHPKDEKEVMEAGADGFVCKAHDIDQFCSDINAILQCFLTG